MSFLGPFYSLYTEYTHSDAVIKYVQEDIICIHINSPLEDVARVESPSPPQDYVPHAKAFHSAINQFLPIRYCLKATL